VKPIPNYHPVVRQEIRDAEPWLDEAVKPINRQLKELTDAAQGQASLFGNTNCESRDLRVEHLRNYYVTPGVKDIQGATCILSAKPLDRPMEAEIQTDGRLRLLFKFVDAPSGEIFVRVAILGA
jgi:hypothetical protein